VSVKRRLPTRKEIGLLRQLNARIGVTRLAQALDIPFYTCRSLLAIDRMTERTLTQVRDRLPKVVGEYLDGPAPVRRKKVVRPPSESLQPVDPDVRAQLNALQPYVSMVRLSQALGFSTKTLRAVVAGYRPLRGSTQQLLRDQLAELLRPPRHLLREALLTPSAAVLQSLRDGFLAPLPGLTTAETEAFVTARPRVAQAG
jgi:hypothetical protein